MINIIRRIIEWFLSLTIIEILIVTTIVGILAGISLPSYVSYKEKAKNQRYGKVKKSKKSLHTKKSIHEEEPVHQYKSRSRRKSSSLQAYERETERLREQGKLPNQVRDKYTQREEVSRGEIDCIQKLKQKGYKITRKETVHITEKQVVEKEY